MKIEFWWIGKTKEKYLKEGTQVYFKRLRRYHKIKEKTIPDIRKFSNAKDLKEKEEASVVNQLDKTDFLVLLDEKGKQYTSVQLADFLQQTFMQANYKRMIFLIAGAYGASQGLKKRANHQMSMSSLTFSHQMIRLFLVEQVYRAFTILRNEKYHNP